MSPVESVRYLESSSRTRKYSLKRSIYLWHYHHGGRRKTHHNSSSAPAPLACELGYKGLSGMSSCTCRCPWQPDPHHQRKLILRALVLIAHPVVTLSLVDCLIRSQIRDFITQGSSSNCLYHVDELEKLALACHASLNEDYSHAQQ